MVLKKPFQTLIQVSYDTAFVIENGHMVMQTDLSLNRHRLRGFVYYINGI